jgi:hypothetical protein
MSSSVAIPHDGRTGRTRATRNVSPGPLRARLRTHSSPRYLGNSRSVAVPPCLATAASRNGAPQSVGRHDREEIVSGRVTGRDESRCAACCCHHRHGADGEQRDPYRLAVGPIPADTHAGSEPPVRTWYAANPGQPSRRKIIAAPCRSSTTRPRPNPVPARTPSRRRSGIGSIDPLHCRPAWRRATGALRPPRRRGRAAPPSRAARNQGRRSAPKIASSSPCII